MPHPSGTVMGDSGNEHTRAQSRDDVSRRTPRARFARECPRVTDAGIMSLRGCARLRHLELTGCPLVTGAAVAELRAALPGCRIEY